MPRPSLAPVHRDFTWALRALRRTPAFTVTAVLTLALAIGANTAIFSAVDAALLRPLPVAGLDRVVALETNLPSMPLQHAGLRAPETWDLMTRRDLFRGVAGYLYRPVSVNRTGEETPERVAIIPTIGPLFDVLGVRPQLGRFYDSTDVARGNTHVVVLSDAYWRAHGADAGVLGTTLRLDGQSYEVVGVLPPEFHFPRGVQLYTPHLLAFGQLLDRDYGKCCPLTTTVARLAPGVTVERLRAALPGLKRGWAEKTPAYYDLAHNPEVLSATPLAEALAGQLRPILLVLSGAVALVLLIACANVASLGLVRTAARARELAVRAALGATRVGLARQAAAESLVVAAAGGTLGVLVGWAAIALIGRSDAALFAMPHALRLDPVVLAAAAGVTLAATLLSGIVPALRAAAAQPGDVLKGGSRGTSAGAGRTRFLRAAVVVQVAVAFLLLLGTGVALRSLDRLLRVDPGFRAEGLVAIHVQLPLPVEPNPDNGRVYSLSLGFYEGMLERLRATPGVSAASMIDGEPFGNVGAIGHHGIVLPKGQSATGAPRTVARTASIDVDYFRAMGIPLVAGRAFTHADDTLATSAVIVDERLARAVFPGQDPIGKELQYFGTIVGVVGSVRISDLAAPPEPALYHAFRQFPDFEETILVRTALPVAAVAARARAAAHELDPAVALFDIAPVAENIDRTLGPRSLASGVLGGLGALALLLAVLGIYGVLSYGTSQRTREIGIRLALGATPGGVRGAVVRSGLLLAGVGLAAGALLFLAAERALASLVYGVSPRDPLTVAVSALLLAGVAVLAAYLPARRAARVDPMEALRADG